MSDDLNVSVRGPDAYALGRQALASMETHAVWPTPLNYELWLHYLAEPEGALGKEIARLIAAGEAITDCVSDELATLYLPRLRINDEIRDAGDQLSKQLDSITHAIEVAQRSNESFGRTLEGAGRELEASPEHQAVSRLVEHLSFATNRVQRENAVLERRLAQSTQEVRQLREHLEQVRRDAMTDALTRLANRKAFDEALERACTETEDAGSALTLAVIDIDHFKKFNDTWGHQTGDQVLRYVATIIGRAGAAPRMASRYGGEEFAVLFPFETADRAMQVLESVRLEISSRMLKRRSTNDDLGAVTVSSGLAERRPGESATSLMERADRALYASKHSGRNRLCASDQETP